MSTDRNQKLPAPPWSDSNSGIEPKYPYMRGERHPDGSYTFSYNNPNEPEAASVERYHSSGNWEVEQYHPETGSLQVSYSRGDTRRYVSGGESTTTDGHVDIQTNSTRRSITRGDTHEESGRNTTSITYGQRTTASGAASTDIQIGGSESINYKSSAGDVVNEHEGNYHEAFQKDLVTSVTKNAIMMVNEGDYALHVQAGNYDTHIKSKARIYADDDILIESASKITLKVGGSTIVITSAGIDMDAPRIDLN